MKISNPIITSPYEEPKRHYELDETGLTGRVASGRRAPGHYKPFEKQTRKRSGNLKLDLSDEYTHDRFEKNDEVINIRKRVALWRESGRPNITPTTRALIDYWTRPDRDPSKRLFFCQIEAVETAIYLVEVAERMGDRWMLDHLAHENSLANPELLRTCFKLATGAGKTVVMAMLMAWQGLNKLASPQDKRFSSCFLLIAPGITIRDRLRVLDPRMENNYYRERDILASAQLETLMGIKLNIINFHQLLQRTKNKDAGPQAKAILLSGKRATADPFMESEAEVVRRICAPFENKKDIIVINDEAHHCYRENPAKQKERLSAEESGEAKKRNEMARVWIRGLEWIKQYRGLRHVYDLSATPSFLKGSGFPEGTPFGWIVSDFSLFDAIECGIVKIPRLPVKDDSEKGVDEPTYRNLWKLLNDPSSLVKLPRKGRGKDAIQSNILPETLQAALESLYKHYEAAYHRWLSDPSRQPGDAPPVFIVVCNNTNVSNIVYRYIAGYRDDPDMPVQAGHLELLRNDDLNGGWVSRPRTILVDSEQLESEDALSKDFKEVASGEIEAIKAQMRREGRGHLAEKLTNKDILREVLNTVGKPDSLGSHVRCVVSVSMLTEGWDANTVTHILGVRAFGTQLLCEQVVGRALRRRSYAAMQHVVELPDETVEFEAPAPEYADIYGVPFNFIQAVGEDKLQAPTKRPVRVRALKEREDATLITFPRVIGYRYELPPQRLSAKFTDKSHMILSNYQTPSWTELQGFFGETALTTLEHLEQIRPQQLAYALARYMIERRMRADDGSLQPWLFPDLLRICKDFIDTQVEVQGSAKLGWLGLSENLAYAAERVKDAIDEQYGHDRRIIPVLPPYENSGSTRHVDFDTTKPLLPTSEDKCHVSHVVADSNWERVTAAILDGMPEVLRYVKNSGLEFTVPFTTPNGQKLYYPDFIVYLKDSAAATADDCLRVVIEVSGKVSGDPRLDWKDFKVPTALNQWVPAVNNHGGFGRWAFIEITNAIDTARELRKAFGLPEQPSPDWFPDSVLARYAKTALPIEQAVEEQH